MDTQNYKKQLKEIEQALDNISVLKKRRGVEVLDGKEVIDRHDQFLIELSTIKETASKIIDAVAWIQSNASTCDGD